MIQRRTALNVAAPRTDWGGSYGDSGTYASMFRNYSPHDFGVIDAQLWSTQIMGKTVNKPFLYMSKGMGNTYALKGGHNDYVWRLPNDGISRPIITAIDDDLPLQAGRNKSRFRVALDRPNYHEPSLLKVEGTNQPMMRIIGKPDTESPTRHWYTLEVQGGVNAWVDSARYLQVGMTVKDASSSVSDELNTKYAGVEFGSYSNLKGQIGYVARKFEVTDKFIRLERSGQSGTINFHGKETTSAVGTGYLVGLKDKNGEVIKTKIGAGHFLDNMSAMLSERVAQDMEYGMVFGRQEIAMDYDSERPRFTGAGWLQMIKDSHYYEHNFDLTLSDFTSKFASIQTNSVAPEDRTVIIDTGTDGITYASRMIELEAGQSPFVFDSAHFIDSVGHNGFKNEKAWGAQFTEFRGYNGAKFIFMYNPAKDNFDYFPELNPLTGRPKESGSFDIYDIGATSASPKDAKTNKNCAFVYEPAAEEYFMVSNVYDLQTGAVQDGGNVANLSKEAGLYRASSYKLEFWSLDRCMRIANV